MHKSFFAFILAVLFGAIHAFAFDTNKHIVVVVWDGMRPDFISQKHTPTLWQLARDGVMFTNHHPVYISSTEVNGTAIATGANPSHSTIIGNREFRPGINAAKVVDTQDIETIRKGDELSHGHFLEADTTAEILQAAGLTTVIAGTKPVVQLHDRKDRPADYRQGILVAEGKISPAAMQDSLVAELGPFPPSASGKSDEPNAARDAWTTRALIGPLWSNGVPAFSLLWLSEPDFSQHPAMPGSPKALAALASSDRCLALVLAELERRHLRDRTDVFVVSDHGFSSIKKTVDIAGELSRAGFSAQREFKAAPKNGDILVNGVGGSTFLYVTGHDTNVAARLARFFQKQPYAGVIFAREKIPGTFLLSDVKVASPEAPDLIVSFRWETAGNKFAAPGLVYLDSTASFTGGTHASLSRYDMHNTLVAAGPDLKKGFVNTYPTGNVDLAPTILWLLGVKPAQPMDGRVLSEALTVDAPKAGTPVKKRLKALVKNKDDGSVWEQYLDISRVNETSYFDEGNAVISR